MSGGPAKTTAQVSFTWGERGAGGMSGSDVTERQSREVHVARVFHVGGELGAEGMSGSVKEAYVWIHGSSQPREI